MDSESELSLSRTSARASGANEESISTQQHRVGRNAAARPRVLQLEAGGDDDGAGDLDGSGAPPQQQARRTLHVHTLSTASLTGSSSFPNGAALQSAGGGSAAPASSSSSSLSGVGGVGSEVEPAGRSGWLYKRGNLNSSWKKRWFVLRYQTLKYYKKPSDTKAKGFISLSAAVLTPGSSDKMRRLFGFEISSLKYTRVFVIHADSEQEMREWMECLQENMNYVRQVIEREKKQNASSSGAAGAAQSTGANATDPYSDTHAALLASRKLPPEQTLDLDVSEEYLKHIGVPARLSAWRRPIARQALESHTADLVRTSALKKGERMTDACCFATHNTQNMMAVGLGSTSSTELEKGAIQLISIETRDAVSNLKQIARFADLEAAADELDEEDEQDRDEDAEEGSEFEEEHAAAVGGRCGMSSAAAAAASASASVIPMPCVGDVCSLSWVNDLLFAGSSGGLVAMYKLPGDLSLASLSKLTPTVMLSHPKVASVPLAAPGKWSLTSRIAHVSLNAVDRRSLLTLANHHFFVWDMEVALATVAPGRPSHQLSEIGSSQPLFAAAWNAHSSNEFMFGGEEGALRLLDTRILMSGGGGGGGGGSSGAGGVGSSCVSWLSKHAHNDVVRDIAWSPLVPHWVASGGDDGLIKVWDLRFGSEPVRVLNGHTAAVSSIAWSRSHCEMLSSAGVDKTLRVWNLRAAPHYALYTHAASLDDFSAPVIHASWSPVHPFQILGGSAAGEAVALHVGDKELMDVYVNHRALTNSNVPAATATAAAAASPPATAAEQKAGTTAAGGKGSKQAQLQQESKEKMDADDDVKLDGLDAGSSPAAAAAVVVRSSADELHERQIETLLFHRDFDRAFRAVAALANRYWSLGQHSFAEGLLKLTSASLFSAAAQEPSRLAAAAAERGQPNPNSLKSFNQLLNDLSRFIPSMTLRLSNVEAATHTRIQFLKTRIAVLQLIKARRWRDILALQGEICSHLERGGGVAGGTGGANAGSPTSGSSSGGSGASSTAASASSGSDGLTSLDQFDASLLEKMAQAVLPFDHLRALEFCLRLGKTLQAAGNFALFLGVARAVFLPTIYERMDSESNAAAQCSWVRVLSSLTQTPIGSAGAAAAAAAAAAQAREESRGSESESDNESSSNSRSNSSQPSRKPSDVGVGLVAPARVLRPSISGAPAVGGASSPVAALASLALSNARASVVGGGGDAHSAQITLDRDLRNPKIVLAQLSLLLQMLTLVANDEDGGSEVSALGSPSSGGSSTSSAAKASRKGSERGGPADLDAPTRFNPFVSVQHGSNGGALGLDTLGFPALSALAAKDLSRLLDDQKEPLKLLPSLIHFLYFHALISGKKYDLLFVSASKINSSPLVRHTHFAAVIEGVINDVAAGRFVRFLERLINREGMAATAAAAAAGAASPKSSSPPAAAVPVGSNLLKLQAAVLTLTNMCLNMDYLPSGLASILPRYLREFTEELRRTLASMRADPDYVPSTSYSTARADVKSKAEWILNQIARIKSHSKSMALMQSQGAEPHCAAQLTDLNAMLRKFVE